MLDFHAARTAGMEFCYARVGRGVPQTTTDLAGRDVRWRTNAADAKAAGLAVGGYWRFYPSRDLDEQVLLFAGELKAVDALGLPPMVDLEDIDGLAPGPLTDWAIRCLDRVEALLGVRPVLYTYRWFLANAVQPDRLAGWELSLAAYTDQAEWIDERATWWQYAGNVRVPWAPQGPVDLQRHRGPLT